MSSRAPTHEAGLTADAVRLRVRQFVVENFLFGQVPESLKDDDSFLETGIVDSTGVLELVAFLESAFDVKVSDIDLVPDNLDSIDRVTMFVCRRRA